MKDRDRLIQEDWVNTDDGPWKVLVICQCLNRTGWVVAERVIREIFERWPTPEDCSQLFKTYIGGVEWRNEAFEVLRPLGFGVKRVQWLAVMSWMYLKAEENYDYLEDYPIIDFPGCGAYAVDAWELFVLKRPREPKDRLLRKYAERVGLYGTNGREQNKDSSGAFACGTG